MNTTLTFDTTVDAMSLQKCSGEYRETLPFNLEGADLNLNIDAEGYVLQLEVLFATKLLELIGGYGGRMVIPERVADPDTLDVIETFPAAPAHA